MSYEILSTEFNRDAQSPARGWFARFLVRTHSAIKRVAVRAIDAAHGLLTGVRSAVRGVWLDVSAGVRDCRACFARRRIGEHDLPHESFQHFVDAHSNGASVTNGVNVGRTLVRAAMKIFLRTPLDALMMLTGRTLGAVQTIAGLEPVGRRLHDDELAELHKIYGDGINYSRVRLKEGRAALFSLSDRAFTHGDTIYVPPRLLAEDKRADRNLLVHEMAHVWQHQHEGTSYMSRALYAQKFGDGYDFAKALREGKSWREMNPEQQAEIIQHAHACRFFNDPFGVSNSLVIEGADRADMMREVSSILHAARTTEPTTVN